MRSHLRPCIGPIRDGRHPSLIPWEDVSFPVRNRGSAGVPATKSREAVSDRSERWRKWSGFPRPLPLKEIAFATVHWTNSGRAPSFTHSLGRRFLPGPKSRLRWGPRDEVAGGGFGPK